MKVYSNPNDHFSERMILIQMITTMNGCYNPDDHYNERVL